VTQRRDSLTGVARLRVLVTEESISAADLETAARLFARWLARGLGAKKPEGFGAALGRTSDPRSEDGDGATDTRVSAHARGGRG
jgi:hypothetical protein